MKKMMFGFALVAAMLLGTSAYAQTPVKKEVKKEQTAVKKEAKDAKTKACTEAKKSDKAVKATKATAGTAHVKFTKPTVTPDKAVKK